MSQQEFEMGPQTNQQNSPSEEDEVYKPQYPYSWSGKMNKEGVPRDEPPSNYDATVMQQGYQAQTPNTSNAPSQQAQVNNQYQYIPPAGDGDAYEQGYRPYQYQRTQGQGVPPWARPQQHRYGPARFTFIIFVLLILALLMAIVGVLGPVIVDIIGGLLILLFIIFFPLLLILLFIFFIVFFRRRGRRRMRYRYRRRGPWW